MNWELSQTSLLECFNSIQFNLFFNLLVSFRDLVFTIKERDYFYDTNKEINNYT